MRTGFILLSVAVICLSCNRNQHVIKPVRTGVTESVYASGIIKSKDQYQVFSEVAGTISKVFVTENEMIEKGSPLFFISTEMQQLSMKNAELAASLTDISSNSRKLEDAKLQSELAFQKMQNDSLLYLRQQSLWQQQVGSKAELEHRELSYESSKTAWVTARNRFKDLEKQLTIASKQASNNIGIAASLGGGYILKSKISGKVYFIYKSMGELVSPQNPLAVVGSAVEFIIELKVDENDISRIKPGQKVLVTMDAYKGKVFEARVTRILPFMDERSKAFIVEAVFSDHTIQLFPNISLEANIVIGEKQNALLLPRNYVVNDSVVWKRNGDQVIVKTGLSDYQYIEILSGLDSADEVKEPIQ
ncbi:MAG: efflux RND transporter periplasmic adaptor subunit [Bacteroidia bacterium]|nr:efflux RND transporter periplasmic adaptor subunit [Bacteroidia bacterium]MCZ2277933.1 efflux RND transporter periplasmic adaptor subunit [Bacteroidia bacterium]